MAKKVEITTVVDNYIDIFIPSTAVASYPVPGRASQLWAEQGLSLWIEASDNDRTRRILYDFGRSEHVLLRNVELLGLDLRKLDYLVLSHGHLDHYGCLLRVLENTNDGCKLIVHPDAYGRKRFFLQKDGTYVGPWEIDSRVFDQFGSRLEPTSTPSDLGLGVHVSGEIEKKTEFEPGMPNAFVEVDGKLVHDQIPDDQSIFIELEGRGIVVLSGCCHAGVVNTLAYARKLFPGQPIYALIGGLHLNSASNEQMQKTVEYLSQSEIRYISGLHCTGYYAQRILMEQFRDCWLPNTVGATLTFTGS